MPFAFQPGRDHKTEVSNYRGSVGKFVDNNSTEGNLRFEMEIMLDHNLG